MKRNWIVLVFALLALASCSVEKRVYQPGYHIEWNLSVSRDVTKEPSQDVPEVASQDLAQSASQNVTQEAKQYVAQDVTQGATQEVAQDAAQGNEQDVHARNEKLQKVIQSVSPVHIENVLAETKMGQSIDSDLELILLIILALILPALTIFLVEGFSKNFWIALLLMAVAYLLPFNSFNKRGLIAAIATILAIAVVFHYM
jgi:uncharacterized membrane protein YqaE (UPF0057 family)